MRAPAGCGCRRSASSASARPLREAPGYPAQLAELLGASRQNLSDHLACLRGCGLVVAVPEGRRVRYELVDTRLGHALGDLLGLIGTGTCDEECCR